MAYDIHAVNRADDRRIGLPPLPFEPTSSAHLSRPHKYDDTDRSGRWQLATLRDQGLSPQSRFLELGPGGGRLAIHVIRYLASGHYAAIDVSQQGLVWLWDLLPPEDRARAPSLFWGGDFALAGLLSWQPDLIWAHSVWTHLPWNDIGKCLYEFRRIIAADGRFLATYFRALDTPWEPQPRTAKRESYGHRDPYHYRFETLEALATETGWRARHMPLTDHPKGQSLLHLTPR